MTLQPITLVRKEIRLLATVLAAAALLAAGAAAASDGDRRPGGNPQSPVPVFVLDKGRFRTFDAPGTRGNEGVDVNVRGQVVGAYIGGDDRSHAFVRDKRGHVTLFDYPGATTTFVAKINNRGQTVGSAFVPTPSEPLGERAAYLRSPDGTFTTISVPGAVTGTTSAIGLDDRGRVVGDYMKPDGSIHGYLWEKGRFVTTTIDGPEGTGASVFGLNDRGQMVGIYQPRGTAGFQGFLLEKGKYRIIKDPRLPFTVPFDINDHGRVVGVVTDVAAPLDAATDLHGFLLRAGAERKLTRIDVPGAPRTAAFGIDDHGRVAGLYENPNAAPSAQRDSANATMDAPSGLLGAGEGR
jgi:hypothetical protein